jgi:hypothetical protein
MLTGSERKPTKKDQLEPLGKTCKYTGKVNSAANSKEQICLDLI